MHGAKITKKNVTAMPINFRNWQWQPEHYRTYF